MDKSGCEDRQSRRRSLGKFCECEGRLGFSSNAVMK